MRKKELLKHWEVPKEERRNETIQEGDYTFEKKDW